MTILLVEDNDDDVQMLRWVLKRAQLSPDLHVATDGQAALDVLSCEGSSALSSPPDLVFLDLKLPYVSGLEILEWIRGNASLSNLPVVILTGSDESKDHARVAQLGALDYIVKPPTVEQISRLLQLFEG
jgi:DNA-binding response OmpR family regulator